LRPHDFFRGGFTIPPCGGAPVFSVVCSPLAVGTPRFPLGGILFWGGGPPRPRGFLVALLWFKKGGLPPQTRPRFFNIGFPPFLGCPTLLFFGGFPGPVCLLGFWCIPPLDFGFLLYIILRSLYIGV